MTYPTELITIYKMLTEILSNPWAIGIGSGIVGAVASGLIMYYVFGIGDRRKAKPHPEISFYSRGPYSNGATFLEIYNSGNEDIENISVTTKYRRFDDKKEVISEERNITGFISESDDWLFTKPSPLNVLRVGEKKLGSGLRNTTIGKTIEVEVRGQGKLSGEIFEAKKIMSTPREET